MPNSFSKFFDISKFSFLREDTSAIGIEIGSSNVKIVQLKHKRGQAVLETYGELALGVYGKANIGQAVNLSVDEEVLALTDLFRESNITSRSAAIAIPLRSSLLKVIEIPAFSEHQINQIVPLEARKYIPVPVSEVALDWWVIPKQHLSSPDDMSAETTTNQPEKLEVLLVAIHQDTINKYADLANKLKLPSPVFEVETFSAIRATVGHDIAPIAILDLGASTSKLTIIDYGIVKVSHVINKGGQDITHALSASLGLTFDQAEKKKRKEGLGVDTTQALMSSTLEYIFYESSRVLLDFQRKYARLVPKVVLVGGGALLSGLLPLAQKTFQGEISIGHAFQKTEAPAFLKDVLEEAGPEFTIAIGLALRKLQETT